MEKAVEFKHVTKAYGDVQAVRDLSFIIERGKLVTLLGPSGCGKTTTLRLIAGLEMATEGSIFIGGKEVTRLSASDRDVSMVFQSYALFPHMTVMQNVSYGLTMSRLSKEEVSEKALEGLELVSLSGFGERLPSELSGGQQQRVAVARALVLEPEVLLFDEPLSNLDAKLRRRVREEIRELQQKLELTTVYVTHDQEEALAVSDTIFVMNEAVIDQEGTPQQLYEEPVNLFVADFIGDANIVKAQILKIDGINANVDIGGIREKLTHRGLESGEVNVAIRPQSICLSQSGNGNSIPGTIIKAIYLGGHIEYTVDCILGELFVIDNQVEIKHNLDDVVFITLRTRGVSMIPES
ncbi:MAG: ABC transporter ATP-binding protein [Deltaproteobacteria bacterium]|nr:ABC transporter ATP-binding protein [Deltaproteobacteria bacterium]